jgi:hypothetical protein
MLSVVAGITLANASIVATAIKRLDSSQSLSTANQWAEFLADVEDEGEEVEFDLWY